MVEFLTRLGEGEVGALLWVAFAYAGVVFAASLIYAFRVRSWPATEGVLNAAEVLALQTTGSDPTHTSRVGYRYVVGGRSYTGWRLTPMTLQSSGPSLVRRQLARIDRRGDGKVRVFYNPKKPQAAYLVPPNGWDIGIVVGLGSLTLLLLGVAIAAI